MGLLDSKTRILDTQVTLEGRRQIAAGKFKVEWISLSDTLTFYEADAVSGSSDATSRIYLETCHLPQDQITFEADDSGRLQPFKNDKNIQIHNGKIFTGSNNITGTFANDFHLIENDQFASLASSLLESSLDNFQKVRMIGTIDPIFDDPEFLAGPSDIQFVITDDGPIADISEQTANINHLESFFQDRRMLHLDNFMYLPPVIKTNDPAIDLSNPDHTRELRIGSYAALGQTTKTDYSHFEQELVDAERTGFCKSVRFDPTSRNNRIAVQFFEIRKNDVLKLEAIDFGTHVTNDPEFPLKKVYFIGKVIVDDNGNYTFIHLFTLVFE